MKILFVCSGNSEFFEISPFIKAQASSLERLGVEVDIFTIKGKGLLGYLRNIPKLKIYLRSNRYNVVHAHYSLCAITVSLAMFRFPGSKAVTSILSPNKKELSNNSKIISSLMGSDVNGPKYWRYLIAFFSRYFWDETIVKSLEMKFKLELKNVHVIPNGIDLSIFCTIDRDYCRTKLNLPLQKKYILFGANPARPVKNYLLAKLAVAECKTNDVEMISIGSVPHNQIPIYLNAVDVLLLTSHWEGSPNIVKEAMACNCPVVSTDVGDVRWLFGSIMGYSVADATPGEIAKTIDITLKTETRPEGRKRIKELHLDSRSVATLLVQLYEK